MRGHVEARGQGTWRLWVYAGRDPETGREKRITRTVHATSRRAAERELTKLLAQVDRRAELVTPGRGRPVRAGQLTVRVAGEAWLAAAVLEPNGRAQAARILANQIYPRLGDVALWRLRGRLLPAPGDPDHDPDLVCLSAFYAALAADGAVGGGQLAPSTVRRVHATLRSVLAYAELRNWVGQNPAIAAKTPALTARPATIPRERALGSFLRVVASRNPELHAFCLLMCSGARALDVAVTFGDFDHRGGVIVFGTRAALDVAGGVVVRSTPTSKRHRRTVTLSAEAADALRGQRRRVAERAVCFGVAVDDDTPLFPSDLAAGIPRGPHWASQAFGRLRDECVEGGMRGMAGVRLYDLRHHGISELLAAGVPAAVVAERAGNSQRTMDGFYRHAVSDADRAAAAVLDRILRGDTSR